MQPPISFKTSVKTRRRDKALRRQGQKFELKKKE
jgi:hypothetical protein